MASTRLASFRTYTSFTLMSLASCILLRTTNKMLVLSDVTLQEEMVDLISTPIRIAIKFPKSIWKKMNDMIGEY